MSESVKPDGIKLNLADPCGLIPCTQSGMGYCDCSECKRKVYELSAQAQHLALTADLRQEIKDRNELYACLLDNKDTAFKDLMILHDKWKNETLKLRQEIEGRKSLEKELTESYERELSGIKAKVTSLTASEEDLVDTLASYQKLVEEYRRVNQELRDNLKAQALEGSK